jgi:hypothetical protein
MPEHAMTTPVHTPVTVQDFVVPPLDKASNLGTRELVEVRLHGVPGFRWIQLFRVTAQRFSRELVASNPRIEHDAIIFEADSRTAGMLCVEFSALVDRINEAVAANEQPSPLDAQRRREVHAALTEAVRKFKLDRGLG